MKVNHILENKHIHSNTFLLLITDTNGICVSDPRHSAEDMEGNRPSEEHGTSYCCPKELGCAESKNLQNTYMQL